MTPRPSPARESHIDDARRAELARMRALATGLLAAMTAVFLLTRMAPAGWIWAGYVGAFAEAAMVGACADWFAVTALFRRPFGLPIPHTAIIPRNQARIGRALGDFIAGEFLAPRLLDRKLRDLRPAERLADWLRRPANIEAVAARVAVLAPQIAPSGTALRGLIGEIARRAARAGPAAPLAARLLDFLWNDAGARALIDRLIAAAADWLAAHGDIVQARVEGNTWAWLPKWVDRLLAQKLTQGLLKAAAGMAEPGHPWRLELDAWVGRLIERLAHDPEFLIRGERWKDALLNDPAVHAPLRALWAELETRLSADPVARAELVERLVARALTALGGWLDEDPAARARLDGWIRVATRRALSPRRQEIGGFVAQVVAGWDARQAVEKLELQVGRDLQYIRINGTLVGGLVGLVIYASARAMGWSL